MGSDLVAKLGVDATAWDAGFKKAASTANAFAAGFAPILAPIAAGIAGVWGASESIGAYKGSLEAQRKLSAVIEATGGAAGLTTSQITDFAAEMQTLTNFEDDATTGAAAVLAAFTNIRGQTFTDTLESAMDLATVMGGDLQSNVETLGKAVNNPAESFSKLAKAGITFTESQKQQIIAMQKSGDMLGAQQALLDGVRDKFGGAAEAVADPWTKLTNIVGDIAENIGSLLVPSLDVVATAVGTLLSPIADFGDIFLTVGVEVAAQLENMGLRFNLLTSQIALFGVQAASIIQYTFTEVAPIAIKWFGENWLNILQTGAANTLTLFENLGKNLRSVWTAVLNFFRTGTFKIDFTPISQGFINTINKLPDIPQRKISELEKALKDDVTNASSALAESLTASRERLFSMYDTNSKVPDGTLRRGRSTDEAASKHDKSNTAASIFSKEAVQIAFAGTGPSKMEELAQKQLEAMEEMARIQAASYAEELRQGQEDGVDVK